MKHAPPRPARGLAWRTLTGTAAALVCAGTIAGVTRAGADTTTRPTVITGSEFDAYTAAQSSADASRDQKIADLQRRVSALESAQPTAPASTSTPPASTSSAPATSSSPAPSPAADRGPSGTTVVFADDFENGMACGTAWRYESNDEYSGPCTGHESGTATRLTFPAGSGYDGVGHAARFELRPGDLAANGERSEIDTGSGSGANIFHEGDEGWLQERIKVAPGIDARSQISSTATNFYILNQWHAGSGSPPLRLNLDADGSMSIGSNGVGTVPDTTVIPAVQAGTWYDIDVHFKMSVDPAKGGAQVYVNGTDATGWVPGQTMADADSYLKIGQYRSHRDYTGVVYFDDVRLTRP